LIGAGQKQVICWQPLSGQIVQPSYKRDLRITNQNDGKDRARSLKDKKLDSSQSWFRCCSWRSDEEKKWKKIRDQRRSPLDRSLQRQQLWWQGGDDSGREPQLSYVLSRISGSGGLGYFQVIRFSIGHRRLACNHYFGCVLLGDEKFRHGDLLHRVCGITTSHGAGR
jgi:hypothetical protein